MASINAERQSESEPEGGSGERPSETKKLEARIAELESENHKLKRIRDALIERVEASNVQRADPYAAFEHSVILAEQVRERTEALNLAMGELKDSNRALTQASHAAQMAHLRLVDAIESVSDAFVLYDSDKYLVLYNNKFANYWRGTGLRIEQGMHLDTIRRMATTIGMVREETREGDGHTIYRLANGSWVQVSEWPTREGGVVMLYTDISDLKASEKARREVALAQKSRLLQQTVDNLSQGVTLVNPDGELEVWNNQFLELTGLAESAVASSVPFSVCLLGSQLSFPPRDGATPSERVLEQRLPDGRVIEIRSHSMHEGGYVTTYTDITESYLYAETLRESERWVRLITDHVPAMIAYVDDSLCVEFTNKVYDEWYGWARGTLLGKHMQDVHGKAQFDRLKPYMDRALSGESVVFEMTEAGGDQDVHLLRSYVPNLDSDGYVVGFFVLVQDVTERRKTATALQNAYQNLEQRVRERTSELTNLNGQLRQEIEERRQVESRLREAKGEAEQANWSKTKFLAAVSHDLLQPLNAARLFTSALLEQPLLDRTSTLVHSVSNSLEDVETLLGTLVDISKLDAGVVKADVTAFRASDLLDNLANEYHEIARSESLSLRFVSSKAVIKSDSQLLARILRNFLTNAVRYTPPQGKILLGCRHRVEGLAIEVWDTGMGIPQDKLNEIFQEFKRILPPHAPKDKGLGLGLAIVDKISRMLQHPVAVSSQEGRGACFSVLVPYGIPAPANAPQLRAEPQLDGCLEDIRVWVVDNDPSICQGMQTLLDSWQCHAVTALSLADLERQVDIARDQVDVIIVDYQLDLDENGEELVSMVNLRRPTPVPVLMITANYSNELKKRISQLGYLLINKPVRPLKLKSALMHLVEAGRTS